MHSQSGVAGARSGGTLRLAATHTDAVVASSASAIIRSSFTAGTLATTVHSEWVPFVWVELVPM